MRRSFSFCWAYTVMAAVLFLFCLAVPTGCGMAEKSEETDRMEQTTPGIYHSMTPEEAKARMDSGDSIIVLDVRRADEYAHSHIPGAVLLPNENIADTPPASLPDLDAEILVYCRSGRRSREAAEKLAAMGYTAVYDFGGIIDWPYETESGQ